MELCEGDLHWFRNIGPGTALAVLAQVELMEHASAGCAWDASKTYAHGMRYLQGAT